MGVRVPGPDPSDDLHALPFGFLKRFLGWTSEVDWATQLNSALNTPNAASAASETVPGVTSFATASEIFDGTIANKAISPARFADSRWGKTAKLLSVTDLNNLVHSGAFYGNNLTNAPVVTANDSYYVLSQVKDASNAAQMIFGFGTGTANNRLWWRICLAGVWTSWAELASTAYVTAALAATGSVTKGVSPTNFGSNVWRRLVRVNGQDGNNGAAWTGILSGTGTIGNQNHGTWLIELGQRGDNGYTCRVRAQLAAATGLTFRVVQISTYVFELWYTSNDTYEPPTQLSTLHSWNVVATGPDSTTTTAPSGTDIGYQNALYNDSPSMSGSPTATTAGYTDNSTRVATTAYVQSVFSNNPYLSNSTTSTPNVGENNLRTANTAYVENRLANSPGLNGTPTTSDPDINDFGYRIADTSFVRRRMAQFGYDGTALEISNGDANQLLQTGFYRGYNVSSAPGSSWFYYRVIRHDDSYISQEAFNYFNMSNYVRRRDGGNWSAWGQVANSQSLEGAGVSWSSNKYDSYGRTRLRRNAGWIGFNLSVASYNGFDFNNPLGVIDTGWRPDNDKFFQVGIYYQGWQGVGTVVIASNGNITLAYASTGYYASGNAELHGSVGYWTY